MQKSRGGGFFNIIELMFWLQFTLGSLLKTTYISSCYEIDFRHDVSDDIHLTYAYLRHQTVQTGAWTDIFLGGATSKFARGARENFIALHLDFIALHLGVERYTSRWSAIKFSRATKNVTQHLN